MDTIDNIGIKLCVGSIERTLFVNIFHCYFVSLRCVVSVSMHYKLCSGNSSYERTAKCEVCHIFKEDKLLGEVSVAKTATLLGVSRTAVSKVMYTQIMGRHHQLKGVVAENQNYVKGIAVH
jgi:hypothetical protein